MPASFSQLDWLSRSIVIISFLEGVSGGKNIGVVHCGNRGFAPTKNA